MEKEYEEIELLEILKVLWKKKFIILVTVAIFTLISITYTIYKSNQIKTVEMLISLGWTEIEDGKYPNQETFKYRDLISSNIIIATNERLNKNDLPIDIVKNNISITPITPKSVEEIALAKKEQGEDFNYVQTSYKVTMNHPNLGMDDLEAKNYLGEIFTSYRLWFEEKFADIRVLNILPNDESSYQRLEYYDIKDIFEEQVYLIGEGLRLYQYEGINFRSNMVNDISFEEMSVKLELISSIYVSPISAIVEGYVLTKNSVAIKGNYENIVSEKTLLRDRYIDERIKQQELIDNYIKNVIMSPEGDQIGLIVSSPQYDQLVSTVMNLNARISELDKDIRKYTEIIKKLDDEPIFEENSIEKETVDVLIPTVVTQLNSIIKDTNLMIKEYNNSKIQNTIEVEPQINNSFNSLRYLIGGVFGGLFISGGFVVTTFFVKKDKRLK